MADIILPGSAYTEQNGYFTNLEGKLQKAYKASYPPEEAKEDWLIINELAEVMNHRKLFNDKDELDSSLINKINLFIKKNDTKITSDIKDLIFKNEVLKIDNDDYYYSNVIARASKTMLECKRAKTNFKSTGTEG
jgi:NADH-quinone oxidoreductase subunit G